MKKLNQKGALDVVLIMVLVVALAIGGAIFYNIQTSNSTDEGENSTDFGLSTQQSIESRQIVITPGDVIKRDSQGNIIDIDFIALGTETLSSTDYNAVKDIQGIEAATTSTQISGSAFYNNEELGAPILLAVGGQFIEATGYSVERGVFLDEMRTDQVVVGVETASLIGPDPIGSTLTIREKEFEVVGVLDQIEAADRIGLTLDQLVFISSEAATELLDGPQPIQEITLLASDSQEVRSIIDEVTRILEARRGQKDFSVAGIEELRDFSGLSF